MTTKCIPPCPSTLMDPKILLPRLNARSSLNIHDRSASDTDIATFTERLMDDAAADIHKLDDEVSSLKAENALLKLTIEHESYNTSACVSALSDILSHDTDGWSHDYHERTFYIPHMDNIPIAKMIEEQGKENGAIPEGRYSYTRHEWIDTQDVNISESEWDPTLNGGKGMYVGEWAPYVKIKLEHFD